MGFSARARPSRGRRVEGAAAGCAASLPGGRCWRGRGGGGLGLGSGARGRGIA